MHNAKPGRRPSRSLPPSLLLRRLGIRPTIAYVRTRARPGDKAQKVPGRMRLMETRLAQIKIPGEMDQHPRLHLIDDEHCEFLCPLCLFPPRQFVDVRAAQKHEKRAEPFRAP